MSTALTITPDLQTPVKAPSQVTPETMAMVVAQAEALRRVALDLKNEKIRTLGRGECFVRMSPDGKQLRAISTQAPVSLSQGHIYEVPGRSDAPPKFKLTAEGYDHLNRLAGIQTITPPTIEVDGQDRPNPYIERHSGAGREGVLMAVHCRVVAVGRSATGNLLAADSRLRWTPSAYLGTALYTAQYKNPADVQTMLESEFLAEKAEGKRPGWLFVPTEVVGTEVVGIAANIRNPAVSSQIKAHSERQKFGERIATTICRRNAIKKLLGVSTVVPNEQNGDLVAYVPIISWVESDSMLLRTEAAAKSLTAGVRLEGVEHMVLDAHAEDLDEDRSMYQGDGDGDADDVEPVTHRAPEQVREDEADNGGALWGEEG